MHPRVIAAAVRWEVAVFNLEGPLSSVHNASPAQAAPHWGLGRTGCEVLRVDERAAELELVKRLVAGDATAWRAFVERYQRLVLTRVAVTAREINQPLSQADAEDLCADVFTQLVAREFAPLRGFEGRSTLSTWLCVITRRLCLRRLAVARRQPARGGLTTSSSVEELTCPQDDPLATLIRGESRRQLDAALAELSQRHQDLVRLFYLDGCSYREISEQLAIPMNSIGPTLQRVQQKLREKLSS